MTSIQLQLSSHQKPENPKTFFELSLVHFSYTVITKKTKRSYHW